MPRAAALRPEQVPAESRPTFATSPIVFNARATMFGSLGKPLDPLPRPRKAWSR